jgi:hypothetical protein
MSPLFTGGIYRLSSPNMEVHMTETSPDYDVVSAEMDTSIEHHLETGKDFEKLVGKDNDHWHLKHKVEEIHARNVESGVKPRQLGVTWNMLNVEVIDANAAINENVVSQFNIPKLFKEARHKPPLKKILDESHGCVKPGEMLLVLGRPGSGCTTLLNMIANRRRGYGSVSGDVWYGSMPASEATQVRTLPSNPAFPVFELPDSL